jgi:putative tricarboxylic transport membrane protein
MATGNLRAPSSSDPHWRRWLARTDVLAGLLFMAVAVVGLWVSRDYPIGTALRMSTGYVPRLLLWVLLLLGGAILVAGLRSSEADHDTHAEAGVGWRAVVLVPAALVAFAVTLERFGLIVACAVLIGIGSLAGRGLRLREIVGAVVLLTFMTWAIFVWALGLPIRVWPEG